jgi:adenylate cyclase
LQDQVASSVVGAIEPKLLLAETARAVRKPTESQNAYDLYLRALAQFQKFTQPGRDAAITLLTQALAIDPSYAPAAAAIGWCRVFQLLAGSQVTASEVAESVRLATQITESGKDQPDALWMAAFTLSIFTGAHAATAGMIDHALALNPNSAYAWCVRGNIAAMQDRANPRSRHCNARCASVHSTRSAGCFSSECVLRMWWRGASRMQSIGPIAVCANNRGWPAAIALRPSRARISAACK